MALGIQTESKGGGDILPIVKFDAKSGDFIAVNREPQSDGTWEKTEVEITYPFRAVADFANIEVGWLAFINGTPNFVMAKAGDKTPPKPDGDYKQCVAVKLFSKEHGMRVFSHTSKNVLRVLDQLHDEYVQGAEKNAGKMPVVEFTGTETVKMQTQKQGELRFKVPKASIVAWVAPPAAFTGAAQEQAPALKPAPKPAPVDDDLEF